MASGVRLNKNLHILQFFSPEFVLVYSSKRWTKMREARWGETTWDLLERKLSGPILTQQFNPALCRRWNILSIRFRHPQKTEQIKSLPTKNGTILQFIVDSFIYIVCTIWVFIELPVYNDWFSANAFFLALFCECWHTIEMCHIDNSGTSICASGLI